MQTSDRDLPAAAVVHRSPGRLRLRVPDRRGDPDYFSKASEALAGALKAEVTFNPETAGILVTGSGVTIETVAEAGREKLFHMERPRAERRAAAQIVAAPVFGADRALATVTGGVLDVPNLLFLLLIGFGVYELARGNFRKPPWYTAFWYAFGVFSKSLLEQRTS